MSIKPTVPYGHLWADGDGISRMTPCAISEFELKSMKPLAGPQWQGNRTSGGMSVMITVQPIGWIGTCHENPKPQWAKVFKAPHYSFQGAFS